MKKHARVSQILSLINDFSHIDPIVLAAKAQIGTNVHTAIHKTILGKDENFFGREGLYVQSFRQWRRTVSPSFDILETRYYDDDKMITGQIDALVKLEGSDKKVLVDWKTSSNANHETWPIQGHLYRHLLVKNGIDNMADHFLFVQLDKRGGFPTVHLYKFDEMIHNRSMRLIDLYWENMKNAENASIKNEDNVT